MIRSRDPRLIIALDVESAREALRFVDRLKPWVGCFKVGSPLFTACGPSIVTQIRRRGVDVFLDLKFFDIPSTVAKACVAAAQLGVAMLTVHASGGLEMLEAARRATRAAARQRGMRPPRLLGVTLLSSTDAHHRSDTMIRGRSTTAEVLRLARRAQTAHCDGVIASGYDVAVLRRALGPRLLIVTPGIRLAQQATHDQRRILTPEEALRRGADALVIGRPITEAPNPVAALQHVLRHMIPPPVWGCLRQPHNSKRQRASHCGSDGRQSRQVGGMNGVAA